MKKERAIYGIPESYLRALAFFTKGFNNEYYVRELQRLLKTSPKTAHLLLNELEKKGILESMQRGKIKIYKLRKNEIVKDYIILAEYFKKIVFLESNNLVNEIISKIKPHVKGIGIIFGSYAKDLQTKESDLDIFVIGSYNEKEIRKVSEAYGLHLSVKNYTQPIFEKDYKKDLLIKEVLDNHIIFKGSEEFIEFILK